jgi:glycosyltransferase involved in cell wall biosynthesis
MDLTFVVPAYNEEQSIPSLFTLISEFNQALSLNSKLLIVENGSRDSTRKVVADQIAKHPELRVKLVPLEFNIGYGGGLKKGLFASDSQLVALLPADGKYKLGDVIKVFLAHQNNSGPEQMTKGARVSRNDPRSVQLLSKILTQLTNCLFRTTLKDVNGLPKIFNVSLIKDKLIWLPDDACFDVGLVVFWSQEGRNILEVPVDFTQKSLNDTSWAGRKTKVAFRMLFRVLHFYLKFNARKG